MDLSVVIVFVVVMVLLLLVMVGVSVRNAARRGNTASRSAVIRKGMTMKEVVRLLGQPDDRVDPYAGFEVVTAMGTPQRREVWSYRHLEQGHRLMIAFGDGRVDTVRSDRVG